ncbi:MAG: hypothetical protein LBK45_02980, partial [Tannerellaceae bacterium]|nr:hypothetical protein [Tannerellaceae bacterium]
MKTIIASKDGRVFLVYRGEDYGSYPAGLISVERKTEKSLAVRLGVSTLFAEAIENTLIGETQLDTDNFEELTKGIDGGGSSEGGSSGGGGIWVPDYANMDATNHISANPGSWTVDRDGYVLLRCDRANANGYNHWRINGNIVASIWLSGDRTMSLLPVKKGDIITLEGGNSTEVMCFFIPPIIIAESPVSVNAIGPPDYANMTASKGVTWTVDADG